MREAAPTAQGDPKLLEAFLCNAQPLGPSATVPGSHSHSGRQTWQQWVGTPLVEDDEDQLYLKGGRSILMKSIPNVLVHGALAPRCALAQGTGVQVCMRKGRQRPSVHVHGALAPSCACACGALFNP